jgi:hypothetical protein
MPSSSMHDAAVSFDLQRSLLEAAAIPVGDTSLGRHHPFQIAIKVASLTYRADPCVAAPAGKKISLAGTHTM